MWSLSRDNEALSLFVARVRHACKHDLEGPLSCDPGQPANVRE